MAKRDLAWAGGGGGGQGQTNTMAEWDQNKNQFSRQSIHFPRRTQQSTIRSDSFIFFYVLCHSLRWWCQEIFTEEFSKGHHPVPDFSTLIFHILGKKTLKQFSLSVHRQYQLLRWVVIRRCHWFRWEIPLNVSEDLCKWSRLRTQTNLH